jgi:hypothetical protein
MHVPKEICVMAGGFVRQAYKPLLAPSRWEGIAQAPRF